MEEIIVVDSTDVNVCCADVIIDNQGNVYYHGCYYDCDCNEDVNEDPIWRAGTLDDWKDDFDNLDKSEIKSLSDFAGEFNPEVVDASNISVYIAYYGCDSIIYEPEYDLKEFLELCGQKLCGLHS